MRSKNIVINLPALLVGLMVASKVFSADEWLATVGISLDPPDGQQQVVSLVIKPVKSAEYDRLIFECIYRQKIPWTDERGRAMTKVIEPVTFTFRRAQVKLVAELDYYCNFRAPYGYVKLTQDFGLNTFAKDGAIVIDRVRITGEIEGKKVWSHEFKAPGQHEVPAAKPPPPPPQKPKNTTFGEVDLD